MTLISRGHTISLALIPFRSRARALESKRACVSLVSREFGIYRDSARCVGGGASFFFFFSSGVRGHARCVPRGTDERQTCLQGVSCKPGTSRYNPIQCSTYSTCQKICCSGFLFVSNKYSAVAFVGFSCFAYKERAREEGEEEENVIYTYNCNRKENYRISYELQKCHRENKLFASTHRVVHAKILVSAASSQRELTTR